MSTDNTLTFGDARGSLTSIEDGEVGGEEEHMENKAKVKPASNSGGSKDHWMTDKNRLFKKKKKLETK